MKAIMALMCIFAFSRTTLHAKTKRFTDISDALYFSENRVLMVNDELSSLIEFNLANNQVISSREVFPNKEEADFEAMTKLDDKLYLLGSHSLKRKRVKSKYPKSTNRQRLQKINRDHFRFSVVRLNSQTLNLLQAETISLEFILKNDPVLAPFLNIPSKENGIDIEGLTISDQGQMYFGFRGPVLRDNYVPILTIHEDDLFQAVANYQIAYVNLDGFGIRELIKLKDGFLILAGPVSDLSLPHKIYFWDGGDMIPSRNEKIGAKVGKIRLLKTLNTSGQAEGISLIQESAKGYEVLIAFDGIPNGGLTKVLINK